MLRCRDVVEVVSDGKQLPWWRKPELWMHLGICSACRLYTKQVLVIKSLARKIGQNNVDPDAEKKLQEEILKKIK